MPRTINLTEIEPEKTCPVCNADVRTGSDCPGYPNGEGGINVCWPPSHCGNATFYDCSNENCSWWYRDPNNRGDKAEMGITPSWETYFNPVIELEGEEA